jgi:hypothetical protein
LLPEDVQRAVAALAGRPVSRRPLLAALRTAYRIGRRSGGRENGGEAVDHDEPSED